MENVETILIDGKEFIVVDEILIDGVKYVYLAEDDDPTKFMVRKVKIKDGKEYIVNLDNKEEFNKSLNAFYEKNHE